MKLFFCFHVNYKFCSFKRKYFHNKVSITLLAQNQFAESNLVNHYIDVDTILKEINDSLTRIDDVLETVNDPNFNDMLHNNVQCVTANYANNGLYDAVEYLMDDVIKEFIDEYFI